MLIGLTGIALAGVPAGMAALGDDLMRVDVRQIVSSPNGEVVIACTEDRVIAMTDNASDVTLSGGGLAAADVSDEGWMALAHLGGVTIHDANGRELLRLGGYTGSLTDLALSPDGLTFAVASNDKVALHRTADGRELWSWRGQAFSVTFHPDGNKVIAGIGSGNLVLNTANGRVVNGFDTQPGGLVPVDAGYAVHPRASRAPEGLGSGHPPAPGCTARAPGHGSRRRPPRR